MSAIVESPADGGTRTPPGGGGHRPELRGLLVNIIGGRKGVRVLIPLDRILYGFIPGALSHKKRCIIVPETVLLPDHGGRVLLRLSNGVFACTEFRSARDALAHITTIPLHRANGSVFVNLDAVAKVEADKGARRPRLEFDVAAGERRWSEWVIPSEDEGPRIIAVLARRPRRSRMN